MASAAQCGSLVNRFIDLELSESRAAPAMTSEDRARLRGRIATEALFDGDVHRTKAQCETEVTEAQYKCAIVAPTSSAWRDCIR
jgi:hypothetical protein